MTDIKSSIDSLKMNIKNCTAVVKGIMIVIDKKTLFTETFLTVTFDVSDRVEQINKDFDPILLKIINNDIKININDKEEIDDLHFEKLNMNEIDIADFDYNKLDESYCKNFIFTILNNSLYVLEKTNKYLDNILNQI